MERLEVAGETLEITVARHDERIIASDKALTLATTELHRRLEGLNGEAGRIRDILSTCVPREVYDRGIEAVEKSSRVMETEFDRRIKLLETTNANMAGKMWLPMVAVAAIAAGLAAAAVGLMVKG